MSVTSFNKNMNNLYYKTVWLALLSIFVALLAAIYFAKNLTAPIRQLDNVAGQISNGDLSVRVKIKSEDEIGRLASTFNKMTDSLKSSQDTLERKVEERTAELGEANRALHTQINEKLDAEKKLKQYNSQLEAFDKIYKGIIAAKSDVQIIEETLTQMPILFNFINNAAVAIEDYTEDFVTIHSMKINKNGQNSFFNIKLPLKQKYLTMEDNPIVRPVIVNDIRQLKIKNQMEENLLKDGLISYTSVPLRIEQDRIGILGIMCDRPGVFNENHKATLLYFSNQLAVAIHQAQLQEQIKKHAKSLQNSLSEKEILLKEIHHRVKNNLQVISSLLYLNSRRIKDDDTLNMFKDSQNRVKSIALVHERLYQSKDLASINFKEYANRLITDLTNSYGVNHKEIKINIDIQNISISIDNAVPCGLIINELISNSLKYAFPKNVENKTGCKIDITAIRNENNEVILSVKDNGKGFSLKSGDKKESSLGLQLVETLVKQLDGTMELDVSSGAAFLIKFKEINI
jgi:two-component sensor histidine kinase/HAMP domain-containing protein